MKISQVNEMRNMDRQVIEEYGIDVIKLYLHKHSEEES